MQIYEYDQIPVEDTDNEKCLSEEEVKILQNINLEFKKKKIIGKSFIKWSGQNRIEFRNYAGIISLSNKQINKQIEILPKIFAPSNGNSSNYEESFMSFARMVSYTFNTKPFDRDVIKMRQIEKLGILDMIIFFYMSALKKAMNDGLYNNYELEMFESRFIRGKICFDKQLSRIPSTVFMQESYIFTDNNEIMTYFKTVTLYFAKISQSNWLKLKMHRLSTLFGDIQVLDIASLRSTVIKFNRLNDIYQDAYNLSNLILSGFMITPSSQESLYGVVFLMDMNKLFENFFAVFIKKNWKYLSLWDYNSKIVTQKSGKHLFIDSNARPLIPDVRILDERNLTKIVFDTKYKFRLTLDIQGNSLSKVSKADLFQMYAYSTKYNAIDTILIYPSLTDTSEVDSLKFEENNRFKIWDINLNLSDDDWEKNMLVIFNGLIENLDI